MTSPAADSPGGRLRALRKRAKLTQDELADKAEIDRSAYNRIENDKIGLGPIRAGRLAKALGVSPVELGGGESKDPGTYRSLHQRLGELEAALQCERRLRERGMQAVTRRLADFEAALESLALAVDPRRTGR